MNKIRDKINVFLKSRYGMDDFGKCIILIAMIIHVLGIMIHSSILVGIAVAIAFFELYRMMSKEVWIRSEENIKYKRYIRLWKVRYQERKISRIFMCKSCGRMIRVPKGKGRLQVTCKACGNKSIHRT